MPRQMTPLTRRRAGITLLVAGAVLAAAAAAVVLRIATQAQAAALANTPQVTVVVATADLPQYTAIKAEAVAVRRLPAEFALPGAATSAADVVGKFTTVDIARGQMVTASQVSAIQRSTNLSVAVPAGKLAFWMPLPDLLARSGGLRAGDRLDILLSLSVPAAGSDGGGATAGPLGQAALRQTTQFTLQDVEVFYIGPATSAEALGVGSAAKSLAGAVSGGTSAEKVIVFLLDPQEALLAKFIKDSGGAIDLVLRNSAWPDHVDTDPVNLESVLAQFRFRVPATPVPPVTGSGPGGSP